MNTNNIGGGKSILLGMPNYFLHKEVKNRLTQLGFTVIDISYDDTFSYKKFSDKLMNFFRKLFFNDKLYKTQLKFKSNGQHIIPILESISGKLDYGLLIRPDFYPLSVMKTIRAKTKVLVGYQWDGMDRYPALHSITNLFDMFYAFDPEDISKYPNTCFTTNFYIADENYSNDISFDVYYLGSFYEDRMGLLLELANYLKENKISYLIKVKFDNEKFFNKYISSPITATKEYTSYEENLKDSMKAKVLIDILHTGHKGLSFRVFEALKNTKKLITNNYSIKNYDFYHPNNIYIITDGNFEDLFEFLNKPYYKIDQEIIDKYNFDNWIKYVLKIDPFQNIPIPVLS